MVADSRILVPTPLFRHALAKAPDDFDFGADSILYDPSKPEEMLLDFRRLVGARSLPPVYVLDIGHFWDNSEWAFVSDAVGRSGTNPLRGLGRIMKEPFIDISRLYHVPLGAAGVEVIALGDRYKEYLDQCPRAAHIYPACSHLHGAAILAHTEGLRVTGVLVSEAALPNFNIERVIQE